MKSSAFFLGVLSLLSLSSCRGMDDDSDFEPETKAGYFLLLQDDGEKSIAKWNPDHSLEFSWNNTFGVPDAALGDFSDDETYLWISDKTSRRVLRIDLHAESTDETYSTGDLVPDYVSAGDKYIVITDSAAGKLGFLKRKNGDMITVSADGHPSKVLYHNRRFYVVLDSTRIAIYSEDALTPRNIVELNYRITHIQLDGLYYLHVNQTDSTGDYVTVIDNNVDDVLSREGNANYSRKRFSPWRFPRFQSEYISNITLADGVLDVPSVPDTLDAFEADFFESLIHCIRQDSLYTVDLINGTRSGKVWLGDSILRAWHHIDAKSR